jgi:hypothetical protein
MHFFRKTDKQRCIAGRQITHAHPFSADADSVQKLPGLLNTFFGPEIAALVVTVSLATAHDVNPVGAALKAPQNMLHVHLAGARHPDDPHRAGVAESHRTCQVRSGVSSEIAAKGNDHWIKLGTHFTSSSALMTVQVAALGLPASTFRLPPFK